MALGSTHTCRFLAVSTRNDTFQYPRPSLGAVPIRVLLEMALSALLLNSARLFARLDTTRSLTRAIFPVYATTDVGRGSQRSRNGETCRYSIVSIVAVKGCYLPGRQRYRRGLRLWLLRVGT
jgi:hypothetical protein